MLTSALPAFSRRRLRTGRRERKGTDIGIIHKLFGLPSSARACVRARERTRVLSRAVSHCHHDQEAQLLLHHQPGSVSGIGT